MPPSGEVVGGLNPSAPVCGMGCWPAHLPACHFTPAAGGSPGEEIQAQKSEEPGFSGSKYMSLTTTPSVVPQRHLETCRKRRCSGPTPDMPDQVGLGPCANKLFGGSP